MKTQRRRGHVRTLPDGKRTFVRETSVRKREAGPVAAEQLCGPLTAASYDPMVVEVEHEGSTYRASPGEDPARVRAAVRRAQWEPNGNWQTNLELWEESRELSARMLGPKPQMVHFTDKKGAEGIMRSGQILPHKHTDTVYAVAVGGQDKPDVQQGVSEGGHGRVKGQRNYAVLFTAEETPEIARPEECRWMRDDALPVTDVQVVPAEQAKHLLDSTKLRYGSGNVIVGDGGMRVDANKLAW